MINYFKVLNITKHLNILIKQKIVEAKKEGRVTQFNLKFKEVPMILMILRQFIIDEHKINK